MTTAEIKELVSKYKMSDNRDGNIRINVKPSKTEFEKIKAAKSEILAYFKSEREKAAAEEQAKEDRFNAIPGVVELGKARKAMADYQDKFDKAIYSGSGIFPVKPNVDVEAIEHRYPIAVWALEVQHKVWYSENYEIMGIAKDAYDRLRNGDDPETVKDDYAKSMSDFADRHIWD